MTDSDTTGAQGEARAWQGGVYPLGGEPPDDLINTTTAEERLEILARLTERAWTLTGKPLPSYERHEIPARVTRPS